MEAAAEASFGVIAVVGCLSWYVLGVLVWAPGLAEVGEPYWGVDGVWSGVVDGVLAGLFASAILFVPLAVTPSVAAGIVLARYRARGVPSPPFDCLRAWLIAPTPAILPAAAFAPFVAVNVAEYHTMYDEAVGETPAPWMQSMWLDVVGSWWIPVVVVAGALMLAVVAACGAFGKELTRRPARCPWCGYDRTGIATVTRCPECGKAPTMNPVSHARERSWFARHAILHWHRWKAFCERHPFAVLADRSRSRGLSRRASVMDRLRAEISVSLEPPHAVDRPAAGHGRALRADDCAASAGASARVWSSSCGVRAFRAAAAEFARPRMRGVCSRPDQVSEGTSVVVSLQWLRTHERLPDRTCLLHLRRDDLARMALPASAREHRR